MGVTWDTSEVATSGVAALRRGTAWLLGLALVLVPVGAATVVAVAAAELVAPPDGRAAPALWWAGVVTASVVAASAADRVVRRHLPLVSLLRLALLLPADVPARLGVALRAHTITDLHAPGRPEALDGPAIVVAYAHRLHRHDRFTRGHSERVRAYADLVGAELGLPATDREKLRWAALVHDIGKIEVSPTLLNKAAALDDEEWVEMRGHAAAGRRLAEPLRGWLGDWVGGIGEHHERVDGSGYPMGLAGPAITDAGRIVAVVDSYETMTARRPYTQPRSHAEARAELVAQAGAHFDPVVVRALLQVSVRRMRWAAGPLALLGDLLAVRLTRALGRWSAPAADAASRVTPLVAAAVAMAVVAGLGVDPAERAVPRQPPPPFVEVVPGTEVPPATSSTTAPVGRALPAVPAVPATRSNAAP